MDDHEARSKRFPSSQGQNLRWKSSFSEAMPLDTESALPDSHAGTSDDAMVDFVEIAHLAESTTEQHSQSASDFLHESASVMTNTFGEMVDLTNILARIRDEATCTDIETLENMEVFEEVYGG